MYNGRMNFVLNLIMCSGLTNTCLPPYKYPDLFVDGYSCMIAGNYESILKLEEIVFSKNFTFLLILKILSISIN